MATILLTDDEEALLLLLYRVLQANGHTVYKAAEGLEALRLGHEHLKAIDLLIADICMPGLDGIELARRLKESKSNLKILFISGYTSDYRLEEPFLLKPFKPNVLLAKVREVLQLPGGTAGTPHTRGR
ncbi:MAG TPA: response regulator [Bryobacteraceae bacterium]